MLWVSTLSASLSPDILSGRVYAGQKSRQVAPHAIFRTVTKSPEIKLVPLAGLEPARCLHHLILSQARLPIPPQGQAGADHTGRAGPVNAEMGRLSHPWLPLTPTLSPQRAGRGSAGAVPCAVVL